MFTLVSAQGRSREGAAPWTGQPIPASALGNIAHVIVMMFENRSFDHLLGAMPGVEDVLDPGGNVYSNLYNTMNPAAPPCGTQGPHQPNWVTASTTISQMRAGPLKRSAGVRTHGT